MRRYEGMDELLKGVRERLQGVRGVALEGESPPRTPAIPLPVVDETYDKAVRRLRALLTDAAHMREALTGEEMARLTDEQRDHLLAVLHEAMEELWACEAGLQGVT
jgi:hypothetical protein